MHHQYMTLPPINQSIFDQLFDHLSMKSYNSSHTNTSYIEYSKELINQVHNDLAKKYNHTLYIQGLYDLESEMRTNYIHNHNSFLDNITLVDYIIWVPFFCLIIFSFVYFIIYGIIAYRRKKHEQTDRRYLEEFILNDTDDYIEETTDDFIEENHVV